jgi:hypothetical protein
VHATLLMCVFGMPLPYKAINLVSQFKAMTDSQADGSGMAEASSSQKEQNNLTDRFKSASKSAHK